MPIPLDDAYKNIIGKKVTNRLGLALENGEIEIDNAEAACDMILNVFDTMKYREEMYSLLEKLSSAWPFFKDIIQSEQQVTFVGSSS